MERHPLAVGVDLAGARIDVGAEAVRERQAVGGGRTAEVDHRVVGSAAAVGAHAAHARAGEQRAGQPQAVAGEKLGPLRHGASIAPDAASPHFSLGGPFSLGALLSIMIDRCSCTS